MVTHSGDTSVTPSGDTRAALTSLLKGRKQRSLSVADITKVLFLSEVLMLISFMLQSYKWFPKKNFFRDFKIHVFHDLKVYGCLK